MGKYDPLFHYLNTIRNQLVVLKFDGIENILSEKLPNSAYKHSAWWDNNSHVQSRSWRNAGYKVDKVLLGDRVFFIKN